MWLRQYLHRRWGLFALVGGVTVLCLWAFGGGSKAPKQKPREGLQAKAPNKTQPSKTLTLASVTAMCVKAGVRADRPPQPNPTAIKHPGFPRPRAYPPRLGPAARGLFPLRKKLAGLPAWRLVHAPMMHRLARGFAERARFFAYLSQNRRALRRWHRKKQERRRKRLGARPPGAVGPAAKSRPPSPILLATRARGYRKSALAYYRQLSTGKQFVGYAKRPAVMLEHASLLMSPTPRGAPQTGVKKRPSKRRPRYKTSAGIGELLRLIKDHPSSPEAIEALAFLAHRTAAKGQCPKVIFMLKDLPSAPLARTTPARLALLRSISHYHAGRCLLAKGSGEAAGKRLLRAVIDARVASAAGSEHGRVVAHEAAILLGRASASVGDFTHTQGLLASVGTEQAKVVSAVLVAQLAKEGLLKQAARICRAAHGARSAGGAK